MFLDIPCSATCAYFAKLVFHLRPGPAMSRILELRSCRLIGINLGISESPGRCVRRFFFAYAAPDVPGTTPQRDLCTSLEGGGGSGPGASLHCGHKKCLISWLRRADSCPLCRTALPRRGESGLNERLQQAHARLRAFKEESERRSRSHSTSPNVGGCPAKGRAAGRPFLEVWLAAAVPPRAAELAEVVAGRLPTSVINSSKARCTARNSSAQLSSRLSGCVIFASS